MLFTEDKLATKADMLALQKDITALHNELKGDMRELEYRLTIRLGGMIAAAVAVLAVLIKIL